MKRFLIYSVLFISVLVRAQNETIQKIKIKKESEISKDTSAVEIISTSLYMNPAEFPGGHEALLAFVKKNAVVPRMEELTLNTKVFVRFIVDADGTLNKIEVIKGSADCKACNEEAIRVVKAMPKWIPAVAYGQALSSTVVLPIQFKL